MAESKDMNVEKTFLQLLLHIDIYVSFTHTNDLYMGIMCVCKMYVYVYVYTHLTERLKWYEDWLDSNSYFSVFSCTEMSLIKTTPNSTFVSDKSRHQRKVKMTKKSGKAVADLKIRESYRLADLSRKAFQKWAMLQMEAAIQINKSRFLPKTRLHTIFFTINPMSSRFCLVLLLKTFYFYP